VKRTPIAHITACEFILVRALGIYCRPARIVAMH